MNAAREELKNLIHQTRLLVEQEFMPTDGIHIESQNKSFFEKITFSPTPKNLQPTFAQPVTKTFAPPSQPKQAPIQKSPQAPSLAKSQEKTPSKPEAELKPQPKNVKIFELHPLPSAPLFNADPWMTLYQQLYPQQAIEKQTPEKIAILPPKFLLISSEGTEQQTFIANIAKALHLYKSTALVVSLNKFLQMNFASPPSILIIDDVIWQSSKEIFKDFELSTILPLQISEMYRDPSKKKELWNIIKPLLYTDSR